jgi:hypothetical protein
MGSESCLQAVGTECELIGGDCGLEPRLVGTECEPKTPLVCGFGCHYLQAVTISQSEPADHLELLPAVGEEYHRRGEGAAWGAVIEEPDLAALSILAPIWRAGPQGV